MTGKVAHFDTSGWFILIPQVVQNDTTGGSKRYQWVVQNDTSSGIKMSHPPRSNTSKIPLFDIGNAVFRDARSAQIKEIKEENKTKPNQIRGLRGFFLF